MVCLYRWKKFFWPSVSNICCGESIQSSNKVKILKSKLFWTSQRASLEGICRCSSTRALCTNRAPFYLLAVTLHLCVVSGIVVATCPQGWKAKSKQKETQLGPGCSRFLSLDTWKSSTRSTQNPPRLARQPTIVLYCLTDCRLAYRSHEADLRATCSLAFLDICPLELFNLLNNEQLWHQLDDSLVVSLKGFLVIIYYLYPSSISSNVNSGNDWGPNF